MRGSLLLEAPFVNARDFGFVSSDTATTDRTAAWAAAIAQTPSGSVLLMPSGRALVTVGQTTNKAILVAGQGHASGVKFMPTTPNDTLLTFTHTGSPTFAVNDDGQLIGCGLKNIGIFSDRSVRANGVYFLRTDWDVLDDVVFYKLDGFAVDRANSRECHWPRVYAKYCGHPALTDPADGVASFIMRSDTGGDTTNLCQFDDFNSVFSFWDCLSIYGTASARTTGMMFGKTLLHALIEGSTALENLICTEVGGTPGWISGVAQNQFSALHTAPSANAASVSGAKWLPSMYKACNSRIVRATVEFANLHAPGYLTDICHRIEQGSGVKIISGQLDGAESSSSFWTSATFTADATANTITFSTPQTHLFTGDAVNLSTTGTLPDGVSNTDKNDPTTYYVINFDSYAGLVYKFATTRLNAEAGTAIDLIDAGTGTHTLVCQHAEVISVLDGSSLNITHQCSIDSARSGIVCDRTSFYEGNPYFGTSISANDVSRGVGPERPVFYLPNADLKNSIGVDQEFISLQGHHKVALTRAIAKSTVGSSAGTHPLGGIFTGAAKTGVTIVDPEFDWSAMVFGHWMPIALADGVGQGYIVTSGTHVYLNIDQVPSNSVSCDITIYGINVDGPG